MACRPVNLYWRSSLTVYYNVYFIFAAYLSVLSLNYRKVIEMRGLSSPAPPLRECEIGSSGVYEEKVRYIEIADS